MDGSDLPIPAGSIFMLDQAARSFPASRGDIPCAWSTQVGLDRPTYFKMDQLWLRNGGFKRDIAKWWHSHLNFGSTFDWLIT